MEETDSTNFNVNSNSFVVKRKSENLKIQYVVRRHKQHVNWQNEMQKLLRSVVVKSSRTVMEST